MRHRKAPKGANRAPAAGKARAQAAQCQLHWENQSSQASAKKEKPLIGTYVNPGQAGESARRMLLPRPHVDRRWRWRAPRHPLEYRGGPHLIRRQGSEGVSQTSCFQRPPAPFGTESSKIRSGALRRRGLNFFRGFGEAPKTENPGSRRGTGRTPSESPLGSSG